MEPSQQHLRPPPKDSLLNHLTFSVESRPPFRLDLTTWVLRRVAANAIDRWDGQTYRRVMILGGKAVEVQVVQSGPPPRSRVDVVAIGARLTASARPAIQAAVERLLGLQVDLRAFYRFAARDPKLSALAEQFRGFKPTRFLTLFEGAVIGIASQQVTLALAIQLLNRVAATYGLPSPSGDMTAHAFPRPEDLASLRPQAFRKLGFNRQKGRAVIELSRAILRGDTDLESLAALEDEVALAALREFRGVGRWTAEYLLLRGMGRTHIFPGDDVGTRKKLEQWLGLRKPLDYDGCRRVLARWAPYAGLIYFHLLLRHLAEKGFLMSSGGAAARAAESQD